MMTPIIAANWKMNLKKNEVLHLLDTINQISNDCAVELIVCSSHCYLDLVRSKLTQGSVGAQNISEHDMGAYTGEHSASMVKSCGASHVILGHSERRHLFGEINEQIRKKLTLCKQESLIPILCVGETLDERNAGQYKTVIQDQLSALDGIEDSVIIAYEPVWAIGTGETATPELADDAHAFIKECVGKDIPILYGGSVNETNAKQLLSMPNINGALIGGASLKSDVVSDILKISTSMIEGT